MTEPMHEQGLRMLRIGGVALALGLAAGCASTGQQATEGW